MELFLIYSDYLLTEKLCPARAFSATITDMNFRIRISNFCTSNFTPYLYIKLDTLPNKCRKNFPQKNLLNLCIGSEEPVLLPLVPLTHGAVGWLYVGFEEFDGSLNLECLR